MPSLRDIQIGFAAAIGDPASAARFSLRVVSGTLGGVRRLQVYRNNYYATLTETLEAVYPAFLRLVGEDFFRYAAGRYAAVQPSRSGDIHTYGDCFGDFLATLLEERDYAYLTDVARLEWAYHEVFHAELRPPMDVESLRAVDQDDYPRLRFEIQPGARLLDSHFPVLRLWQVNRAPWEGDCAVRLDAGGDRLLIVHDDTEVAFHRLRAGEYALLQGISKGLALTDAHALAVGAQADFDLGPALNRHVHVGTFAAWHL